jgi:hypothetical protein
MRTETGYHSKKKRYRFLKQCLSVLLSVALVITMAPIVPGITQSAYAGDELTGKTVQPAVVITGKGLLSSGAYSTANIGNEKSYTLNELKAIANSDANATKDNRYLYSAYNTYNNASMYLGEGVRLDTLLAKSGVATSDFSKNVIALVAPDGYSVKYDPSKKTVGDTNGANTSQNFGVDRYYYPGLRSEGAGNAQSPAKVPTILAWARGGTKGSTEKPTTVTPFTGKIESMTGQIALSDYNNPLFNSDVKKVLVGDAITDTVITIDGTEKTRSDILMMERADRRYNYSTAGGDKTDYVRGVPISILLSGYAKDDVVTFSTADNYPVVSSGKTVGELISGNYMLAYERGTSITDLTAIYETAKNDSSIYGCFTLYGDGEKPSKLINCITVASSSGVTPSSSSYKHINNGGITGQNGPYDIDAITGATLTIEGPGVKSSVPLPIRELESQNAGVYKGVYKDIRGGKEWNLQYEGIRLSYIVNDMTKGDNGIHKTKNAHKVLIKNRVRQTIAEFTLGEIAAAEAAGRPIIIAYGTGNIDETAVAPFVYDGAAGFKSSLDNDDGPIKLVYDKTAFVKDPNPSYQEFGNVAYIYLAEEKNPGYKHNVAPYDTAENSKYVLTVTGDKIGREVNYTVDELEDMVQYGANGAPVANGMGHRGEYSMANSAYWYVNEYEGVQLWKLLQKSGLPTNVDKKAIVSFTATDNYKDFDKFTIEQVSNPNLFGYYEKNPDDLNDGNYKGIPADLKSTGYPVIVAYGVNSYPYVISNKLDGFMSGLSNDGGPLRIISGKMEYSHANGSKQAKLLDKIIVGEDKYYSTHKYNPNQNGVYQKLAETSKLNVKVLSGSSANSPVLMEETYKVGDLEELLYGGKLTNAQLKEAKVKDFYEVYKNGSFYNDLYEGVDLVYFLEHVVGLPGYKGTITFSDGSSTLKMGLEEVLAFTGCNGSTKLDNLSPVIAYAKNGAPMVKDKESTGYENEVTLAKGTPYEQTITVKNNGGPLSVLFPRATMNAETVNTLNSVTSITINLSPDNYAHTEAPYNALANKTITVSGEGTRLTEPKAFSVSNIEGKQTLAVTGDYNVKSSKGQTQTRFRGIPLYNFLASTDVGLKPNADKVIVTCADKTTYTFPIKEVLKSDYINGQNPSIKDLKMILAYGSSSVTNQDIEDGKPLVSSSLDKGYIASYSNAGGPICLVVGQTDANDINSGKILKNVTSIEVTASDLISWNHSSSAIYEQYLNEKFTLQVVDKNDKIVLDKTYTLKEIESFTSLIERANITWVGTQEWEGINLWDLVLQEASAVPGISNPISVTAFATDGFSKELRSIFGMDALENGIKDGELRVPIILGYGVKGYPLVPSNTSDGYTAMADNGFGPIRLMTHGNQGACLKNAVKLVVKVDGSGIVLPNQPSLGFNVYAADGEAGNLPLAGIRSIWVDDADGLWVSTYGGGVAYKAAGAEKFTVYNTKSEPALAAAVVSAVAADKNGGVWMTQNASYTEPDGNRGVAYMKDGKVTYFTETDNPKTIPSNYVQEIQIDDNGNVWFGSFGGLTKYNPATGEWKTWDQSDGFPAMSIDNLILDNKGGVWCGFYPTGEGTETDPFVGGFAYMDKEEKITKYQYTADYDSTLGFSLLAQVWVRDIAVDENGGAWVVASGSYSNMPNVGGTIWYVDEWGRVTKYTGHELLGASNLTNNSEVRMVTVDSYGGLWFGTSGDGVFYIADPGQEAPFKITAHYSGEKGSWDESPLLDNVYSLDFVGNTLYVGSSAGLAYQTLTPLNGGIENTVNRGKFLTMLANFTNGIKVPVANSSGFGDVSMVTPYGNYAGWAGANGLISGYGDGSFRPYEKITREEIAVMVDKFISSQKSNPKIVNEKKNFKDQNKIGDWSKASVSRIQQYGIVCGRTDGTFDPSAFATRIEIMRILDGYKNTLSN